MTQAIHGIVLDVAVFNSIMYISLQSEANVKGLIVSDAEVAMTSWGLTPHGKQQVLEVS